MPSSVPPDNTSKPWQKKPWASKIQVVAALLTIISVSAVALECGPEIYEYLTIRELTNDTRGKIGTWARKTAVDGVTSGEERRELEQLVTQHRLSWDQVDLLLAEIEEPIGQSADLVRQGVSLIEQADFREAHDRFLLATSHDDKNIQAWVNLGATSLELGLPLKAQEALRKALELEPGRWTAHYNLGASLAASGSVEPALARLERAMALAHSIGLTEEEKESVVRDLVSSRWLEPLHGLPRFQALLQHEALAKVRG